VYIHCTAINHRFSVEKNEKIVRLWLKFLFIFFFSNAFPSVVIIILSAAETILNQLAGISFFNWFRASRSFLLVKTLKVPNIYYIIFSWNYSLGGVGEEVSVRYSSFNLYLSGSLLANSMTCLPAYDLNCVYWTAYND